MLIEDGGTYISHRQGEFSKAYLQAVVAVAGYRMSEQHPDDDSVDWTISGSSTTERRRRAPKLDLQLKCRMASPIGEGDVSYPLKLKNYNELRGFDFHVPRILLVVFVPDQLQYWLEQSDERLSMKHCGYWVSLRDEPEVDNLQSVTVHLPRSNVFTVEALGSIMRRIGNGGDP